MGKVLRWALLGCGRISGNFALALGIADRDHQVRAIAGKSAEECEKFKTTYELAPDVNVYCCYEDAIQDPDVDVVYVALCNNLHKRVVLCAVEQGKHCVCEKPLGVNAKEVQEIADAARRKKVFVMEGYWSKFFPAWKTIKEDVKHLGDLRLLEANFCSASTTDPGMDAYHGGGMLLSRGCYTVMLALWLANGEKPVRVDARGKLTEAGTDLWGSIILEFKDGFVANLFYSGCLDHFWCPTEYSLRLDGPFEEDEVHMKRFPIRKATTSVGYTNGSGYYLEADHVYDCIAKGLTESTVMSLDDSLALASILDDVRRQLGVKFPQDE
ncbi:dihydrodiol dehydrogenase (dimeric) [Aphelenchoides avenae]|nr:dihydrodiol dehydrogenase (dimeric) [Aphelenchus avenae]